jgi:hypothetical protein
VQLIAIGDCLLKTFNDYQQGALRTLHDLGYDKNLLHCVMGMSGEIGEYIELPDEKTEQKIGEIGPIYA